MPFEIYHQPFGLLTEYFIQNTETGEYVSILPAHGGIVRKLVLRKGDQLVSVMDGPASPQALLADETYAGALLFPFPSRIRHGIYLFEDQAYTLPMNETAKNHAIHGFVAGQPFDLAGQTSTDQDASLLLRFRNDGTYPGYPFPFEFQVIYTLTPGSFQLRYEALNTGSGPAPVGFGWHPYFSLNEEPVDQLTISIPASREVILNEEIIPEGERPFNQQGEWSLHERQLDSCFIVDGSESGGVATVLRSPRQGLQLTIWQETGPQKFNYLVVFTPPKRSLIAIEPLTCNVNAFNNGQGLIVLPPNEVASGNIRVHLE